MHRWFMYSTPGRNRNPFRGEVIVNPFEWRQFTERLWWYQRPEW